MESGKTVNLDQLKLEAQEYSVYITDTRGTSSGSGVLYYPGDGERLFIFTCAHVLDDLVVPFQIYYFVPVDRKNENYRIVKVEADRQQVVYSPIDSVTQREDETKEHSVDVAVICLSVDHENILDAADYIIGEAHQSDKIFIQGFPGAGVEGMEMLEYLDCAKGTVLHNIPNKEMILCRIEDTFLDQGNRIEELEGFSGSPVWSASNSQKSILGMLSCGFGDRVYRGKVKAVTMNAVISIMKNHFEIYMEKHILGIPEDDVAPEKEVAVHIQRNVVTVKNIYDEWLVAQTEKVRTYIDDVKFQKAIDLAKESMNDERFSCCSRENIIRHMKILLYCYEGCLLLDEYYTLEENMREHGYLEEHDPIRWLTLNFGNRNFKETATYAKKLLEDSNETDGVHILARVYLSLCRAYEENAPVDETIGIFLDERESLIIECKDADMKTLIYQMLGYTYGEHYHEYTKSIRCLNRAYRLGMDHAVLETLGCAYYFFSIENALREDNTVDMMKIDRAALYKARECFLILWDKADELYRSVMMKREGGVIFNTFYFQQDNYRILTIYPYLMSNLVMNDNKERRDFEKKYAMIVCQSGNIDLTQFHYLEEEDRILFSTLADESRILNELDMLLRLGQGCPPELEGELYGVIEDTETNLPKIDERERISVVSLLLNLYGHGRKNFGWNVASKMNMHIAFIRQNGDQKMIMTFENFLYENTHSMEVAEKKFIESYEKAPSFITWQELLQFYKRNMMLYKADALFEDLFCNHMEYVEAEPEYSYRAYIMYILNYARDIKYALRFYLEHKADMKDENIRTFCEHELMFYTNCFNNPEQFEEERRVFVEQGLIPKEEFHRILLIVYMCNLDSKHAWEHFSKDNPYFGIFGQIPYLTREGAQFLIWQRRLPPHMEPEWNGMNCKNANVALQHYKQERWHVSAVDIVKRLETKIQRTIAIDAWGLYLLAISEKLDYLLNFDYVYVTHLSITRMLEEMTHYKNDYLESIIAYLEVADNVKLQSPEFEAQLMVREVSDYFEPCSTIAMAVEAGVPAVIGASDIDETVFEKFKNYIIRPSDIEDIMK